MTSIIYEVQDPNTGWTEYRDDELALAPAGVVGLSVTVENAGNRSVSYQAYYNGKWNGESKNGDKIGDGTTVFQAVRVLLSFRRGHNIKYTVINDQFKAFNGMDDQPAGDPSAGGRPLRAIRIRYV